MIVRDDEKVKKIIAENIVRYRRECNLTQAELAEKIHYSDKSVSKWERADGVPDIFVLVMLAELFGVTVNDLLTEKHRKSHRAAPKLKRSIITLMSAGLVWLVAAVVFFAFKVAFPDLPRIWLAFIYAIPAMFIVTLVLSALWHPPIFSYLSVCGIVWGVALSVDISLNVPNVSLVYIIAAVLQVLIGTLVADEKHLAACKSSLSEQSRKHRNRCEQSGKCCRKINSPDLFRSRLMQIYT